MKNKLVVVCCTISLLASAAALLSARAHAAAPSQGGLTIIAEDAETRVYTFSHEGHQCFVASTRGGSGVSLQCPR